MEQNCGAELIGVLVNDGRSRNVVRAPEDPAPETRMSQRKKTGPAMDPREPEGSTPPPDPEQSLRNLVLQAQCMTGVLGRKGTLSPLGV